MLVIGLMSGTSAYGIDAALVEIEGEGRAVRVNLLGFICAPHSPEMRKAILDLCDPATGTVPDLCALDFALGQSFADAAVQVAREAGVTMKDVVAIASHGQTVWHQPEPRTIGEALAVGTIQIGSPAVIAARTGCRVVSDFRAADMAAGGQGAPLVPYFDWAVLTSETESRAALNIGGIANVTYLPSSGEPEGVIAFDTGPGNMLIDALADHYSSGQERFDRDGVVAAAGSWNPQLGNFLLAHPYFGIVPPKSTGREVFGGKYAADVLMRATAMELSAEDALATVTELTARTIADAVHRWLPDVERVIVGGGGRRNRTLMAALRELIHPAILSTQDELGIPGDAKEAMAFALLAYETLHGRPSNVPSATGARERVVLGSITPPPRGGTAGAIV